MSHDEHDDEDDALLPDSDPFSNGTSLAHFRGDASLVSVDELPASSTKGSTGAPVPNVVKPPTMS